ncbi:unnamed protein product, partial [Linum tenue]
HSLTRSLARSFFFCPYTTFLKPLVSHSPLSANAKPSSSMAWRKWKCLILRGYRPSQREIVKKCPGL